MRRSALKPSTKPLKRTLLRRKSQKRPKWEDRELVARYQAANPMCELAPLFPLARRIPGRWREVILPHEFGEPQLVVFPAVATDPHHILGGVHGCRRWDLVTHILNSSRPLHNWVERYVWDGIVLCLYVKMKKNELDAAKLGAILHPNGDAKSFADWVSTIEPRLLFDIGKRCYREVQNYLQARGAA